MPNSAHVAFTEALGAARRTATIEPPLRILNAPTKLMERLATPRATAATTDEPGASSGQEFFPEALTGAGRPELYRPNDRGHEREVRRRQRSWAARRDGREPG